MRVAKKDDRIYVSTKIKGNPNTSRDEIDKKLLELQNLLESDSYSFPDDSFVKKDLGPDKTKNNVTAQVSEAFLLGNNGCAHVLTYLIGRGYTCFQTDLDHDDSKFPVFYVKK